MFETGLPAIVYEENTGEDYHPVMDARHCADQNLQEKAVAAIGTVCPRGAA